MPKTAFRPETDGFAFANAWHFDQQENDRLRVSMSNALDEQSGAVSNSFGGLMQAFVTPRIMDWLNTAFPEGYGLCGGMTFAARDYFLAKRSLPRGSGYHDQPTQDTPAGREMRNYLWQRQMDSLRPNAPKMLTWMVMLHIGLPVGGADWVLDRTREEWRELKTHLDNGQPWPLCLVGSSTSPFNNHQVLACGYDDPGDGTGTITTYDMNCPGGEQTIHLDMRGEELVTQESCASAPRGALRGFFCETYVAAVPPEITITSFNQQRV